MAVIFGTQFLHEIAKSFLVDSPAKNLADFSSSMILRSKDSRDQWALQESGLQKWVIGNVCLKTDRERDNSSP
jgi:hypothetical protein